MEKYLEAEKQLAELLGWTRLVVRGNGPLATLHGITQTDEIKGVPRWCRNWSACGPLLSAHIDYLALPTPKGSIVAEILGEEVGSHAAFLVDTKDHPDRDTAVRYCVVMAVIAKLSTQQEG